MTEDICLRFCEARREYIASQFAHLNDMQKEAVLATEGPMLLLAGAGSGKTTVLINKIANLLRFGCASDSNLVPDTVNYDDVLFLESVAKECNGVDKARADYLCSLEPPMPWNIIAITFTNKAANELKERLISMLGPQGQDVWAMTFHSACCRILRKNAEYVGLTNGFTIYDTADSERVMKDIIREMGLDEKSFSPKYILAAISREKDAQTSPERLAQRAEMSGNWGAKHIATAYANYQKKLRENNAVDFDDIILLTVKLLQEHEDIRAYYQKKFRYVLVDEYQDTNHLQYLLTSLLAGGCENICVVGDDDQSIYRFRGATIENILNFEKQYKGSRVIRLEQNYRSTKMILEAANSVIAHNKGRKGKKLWTSNIEGDPITVYEANDEGGEANYIAGCIIANKSKGIPLNAHAILYRTNAQSNALEYAFKRHGISYKVIGGMRFFDRAEVKDMLAYLCVLNNRSDDLRLKRIINNPPRGIGAKTIEVAERLATATQTALYNVVSIPESYAPLEKATAKLKQFSKMIEDLTALLQTGISLPDFYEELMQRTGYADALSQKETEESKTKLENIRELKSSIISYTENAENPTLSGFLEEIALYTDIEQYNEDDDAVVMMTVHSAKGLEFPHVFMVGMEDGLFPGSKAIGDVEEMEEERRLCYVAITRAEKTLTISHARQRMIYGRTNATIASRFLKEIPESILIKKGGYLSSERYDKTYTQQKRNWNDMSAYRVTPVPQSYSAAIVNQTYPEFRKGEMVEHTAFGQGLILSVLQMNGDALLEIAFDRIGTKKLMAKSASSHMKKL